MSDTLANLTPEAVLKLVRRYVTGPSADGLSLDLIDGDVERRGDWWYVAIRNATSVRTYKYYDVLTEIEDEIAEREGLSVLLIPSA